MKLKLKYPKTVVMSALHRQGIDQLAEMMIKEVKNLRCVLYLKIPQSRYEIVSELMEKGHVLESSYQDNDIIMKAEVPKELEHRVRPYVYALYE